MSAYDIVKRFVLFSVVLLLSSGSIADGFKVQSAQVRKVGNGYILNANIEYPLTPRVKEALSNGVPITFQQQLELSHSTSLLVKLWQWETILWTSTLRYELRYHALSEQFVLKALDTGHHRNFPSLASALSALGTISSLNLPPEYLSDTDGLVLKIRSGLDLHALPTPMRPGALISTKWQLTSPWTIATWP
ncbi:MAG: DUF4390 domain-containing protein [Gammaproteobacteria bacterium]|nr:DUF4390 domain-containing protein [Gammaproteobacteria bacterium]MDH5592249.1 DUF4390 domain-containing protein [Gammaproteobacteria bacterium]